MPNHDFTSKLLEMEDIIITDVSSSSSELHISFSLKRKPHTCPNCSFITEQIHDYRTSVIKDIPVMGKQTFLHYRKRRYHCPCCNKHFYESFQFLPKYCRITTRLAFYAIHLLKNRYSVTSSAKLLGISVSSVFRSLVFFPRFFLLMNLRAIPAVRNSMQFLQMRITTSSLISFLLEVKLLLCSISCLFRTENRCNISFLI